MVIQRMDPGQTEYTEGKTDLGMTRENPEAGRIRSNSLRGIILHGSIGCADFWGKDMGTEVFDG